MITKTLTRIKPQFDVNSSVVHTWNFGFRAYCSKTKRTAYIDGNVFVDSKDKRHFDYTQEEIKNMAEKLALDEDFDSKLEHKINQANEKAVREFNFNTLDEK